MFLIIMQALHTGFLKCRPSPLLSPQWIYAGRGRFFLSMMRKKLVQICMQKISFLDFYSENVRCNPSPDLSPQWIYAGRGRF